jgi:hypothetical protein
LLVRITRTRHASASSAQTRPSSLFLFTIAASGERKSTADNEALIPVRIHEQKLKRDYSTVHEAWRISHVAWAAEHKKIEANKRLDRLSREAALFGLGRAPIEPVLPLFTAPEPTVEALGRHWGTLPGSLGLFSPEGGQLTGGFGFGPEHRLKTAACLSALWDGAGLRRFRASDGVIDLPGRRLALHPHDTARRSCSLPRRPYPSRPGHIVTAVARIASKPRGQAQVAGTSDKSRRANAAVCRRDSDSARMPGFGRERGWQRIDASRAGI